MSIQLCCMFLYRSVTLSWCLAETHITEKSHTLRPYSSISSRRKKLLLPPANMTWWCFQSQICLCVCVCLSVCVSVCNALTLKVHFWYAVTSPEYLAQVRKPSLSDQGQITGSTRSSATAEIARRRSLRSLMLVPIESQYAVRLSMSD